MRSVIVYLVCLIVAATIAFTFSPHAAPLFTQSDARSDRMQINGLVKLPQRLVAVGERGSIMLSEDQGVSWRQASVNPQRNLSLTAVVALSDEQLLAVGHDGLILRSENAGLDWKEVHYDSELGEPFLGVWAAGGNQALAFGSFGKFYQSEDAGKTWTSKTLDVDSAHLNSMDGGADGRRMLVGESGLVLRTRDAGQHWETLVPFYDGSLFGVARLSPDRWVAYGMRGHVFVSQNFGESWEPVKVGNQLPLYGHVVLPDNAGMLIVGAGSSVVHLDGSGRLVGVSRLAGFGTLTSALVINAQTLLVGSDRGVFQSSSGSVAALGK